MEYACPAYLLEREWANPTSTYFRKVREFLEVRCQVGHRVLAAYDADRRSGALGGAARTRIRTGILAEEHTQDSHVAHVGRAEGEAAAVYATEDAGRQARTSRASGTAPAATARPTSRITNGWMPRRLRRRRSSRIRRTGRSRTRRGRWPGIWRFERDWGEAGPARWARARMARRGRCVSTPSRASTLTATRRLFRGPVT